MEFSNFFDNVENMKRALGLDVEIKTVENQVYYGTVHSIDPISETVVLMNVARDRVFIIMRHAITSIVIENDIPADDLIVDYCANGSRYAAALDEHLKEKVVAWLRSNLINVVEDGDTLRLEDHLTIEPPYFADNCYCNNTIVLERIRNILQQMPN